MSSGRIPEHHIPALVEGLHRNIEFTDSTVFFPDTHPCQQIHLGIADEISHEQDWRGSGKPYPGCPFAGSRPAFITAILVDMVMASIWSWVT